MESNHIHRGGFCYLTDLHGVTTALETDRYTCNFEVHGLGRGDHVRPTPGGYVKNEILHSNGWRTVYTVNASTGTRENVTHYVGDMDPVNAFDYPDGPDNSLTDSNVSDAVALATDQFFEKVYQDGNSLAATVAETIEGWKPSNLMLAPLTQFNALLATAVELGAKLEFIERDLLEWQNAARNKAEFYKRKKIRLQSVKHAAKGFLQAKFALVVPIQSMYDIATRVPPSWEPRDVTGRCTRHDESSIVVSGSERGKRRDQAVCKISAHIRVTNPVLFDAARLGVLNPLGVAWELVRLSWLVDYFFNISQLCLNIEHSFLPGIELSDICRSRLSVTHCEYVYSYASTVGEWHYDGRFNASRRRAIFERDVLSSIEAIHFPVVTNPLKPTLNRCLTLLSLIAGTSTHGF